MRLEVKVFPASPAEKVVYNEGMIKVYVKAAPDRGRANDAAARIIAKEYGVNKRDVRIVSGKTSRKKILEIPDGAPGKAARGG